MVVDESLVGLWYLGSDIGRGADVAQIVKLAKAHGYYKSGLTYAEMYELTKTALLDSCGKKFLSLSIESFEIEDTKSIGFRLVEVEK